VMLRRTHNTSETYSLSPPTLWPSSTGAKPVSPCARKDSPPFLPYISNNCLAIERRTILNVDVDKIEAAEASVDPGALLRVFGLDRRYIATHAKKCFVGERRVRVEADLAQLGGGE
jgi:hypothetical protein